MDTTKATADTPDEAAKNTDKATASGDGTQTDKTADAPKFTQADLDRIAAKTRKEEREKLAKEQAEAEAKRNEEEAKKQGEFEKLYAELKPQHETATATLAKYQETVKAIAEADLNALPDEVKDMAPDLADPLAVLAWLPKGKKLAEKLDGAPAKPGAGGDPKPKGAPGEGANDKRAAAQSKRTYQSL